jgi:hypothetical protein
LKSVVGTNIKFSDVLGDVATNKLQLSDVVVIVHNTVLHNLTSQLPAVCHSHLTVILYWRALVNVSVCLNVFTPVLCVAPVAPVVHQAQTVHHVSLVRSGVVTILLPRKLFRSIISILLSEIHIIFVPVDNIFVYVPVDLLYIPHQVEQPLYKL